MYSSLYQAQKELDLLPFYLDGKEYRIDFESWEQTNIKIENEINTIIQDGSQQQREAATELLETYHTFLETLAAIRISEEEFNHYLHHNKSGKAIEYYEDVKNEFIYAIIESRRESISFPGMSLDFTDEDKDLLSTENSNERSGSQLILNHNNPFADITIKNQKFLYPNTLKQYETLSFNVGYTMSEYSETDKKAIVLQPDFKIEKSKSRNSNVSPISMDDTLSTPMADTAGDKTLLYI